ncbi:hypothetical protein Pcinc_000544 [Petrolisthes cinctipes]|uniref:Ionotropic glutamate receptor C-terminal domain-containing protein n=1 Tax=Petrolisthes cinctipes TaxID=88211 RepID=A0AAE1GPE4_PETCI|nr:hypothetical protein Pcinc_000544 [Petrolisthes cinctipes]
MVKQSCSNFEPLLIHAQFVRLYVAAHDTSDRKTPESILPASEAGCHWLPKKDGGRLLVSTWLVASLVFMTCYSGILTAMLTLPRVNIPIDSLSDLVAQSRLPWRIEAGSMMFHYFQVL